MTIKKAYIEIMALLEASKGKKLTVKLMDELRAMCESKNNSGSDTGSTLIRNDENEVIAIYCYYFKQWLPLCDVEFGAKNNTASGYNTMCKSGVSLWSKQQREAKKSNEQLLDLVAKGEIQPEDIDRHKTLIEEIRKNIAECKEVCFDTSEQVLEYIKTK